MQLTQGQSLLAILALVYFSDCFYWCRLSGLVFSASRFTNWRVRRPDGLMANRKGGLVLLPVLPPLGWSHLIAPRPFILSPMGVCFNSEAGLSDAVAAAEPVALSDLADIESRGNELYLNKKRVAEAPNRHTAKTYVRQLQALAQSEDPNSAIRAIIKGEFNLKEFASAQLELYRNVKRLRVANLALILLLFVYVPFMSWMFGLASTFLFNLAVLFIAVMVNTVLFYRAHTRLLPDEKGERLGQVLLQLISWPMATRGADVLTRNAFATFHPLAAASIILPPDAFQSLTADWYRRLKYPCQEAEAPDRLQRCWQAAVLADTIDELLPVRGWDRSAALQAPTGQQDEKSYCPRCHAMYVLEEGTCTACTETALLPLPSTKEA